MTAHVPGLGQRPDRLEFSAPDARTAEGFLRDRHSGVREARLGGDGPDFRFRLTSIPLHDFQVQSIEHSGPAALVLEPQADVVVTHVLAGTLEVEHNERWRTVPRGQSYLTQAHSTVALRWSDVRLGIVRVRLAEIEDAVAELTDRDPVSLRFTDGAAVSPEAERYWQAVVRLVNREVVPNAHASTSEIVQRSISRLLAATLLETFPNTAAGEAGRVAPPQVTSAALRRAVAFIEEHASEAISMSDIAAAARVTPRSLQHGFRRAWDLTPTTYLRRVRLERAHRDLQAGDPSRGDTVAEIAARWGFGNVGRFAARYRERYGRSPNEVLRS